LVYNFDLIFRSSVVCIRSLLEGSHALDKHKD
jgi:hypothetical protein